MTSPVHDSTFYPQTMADGWSSDHWFLPAMRSALVAKLPRLVVTKFDVLSRDASESSWGGVAGLIAIKIIVRAEKRGIGWAAVQATEEFMRHTKIDTAAFLADSAIEAMDNAWPK